MYVCEGMYTSIKVNSRIAKTNSLINSDEPKLLPSDFGIIMELRKEIKLSRYIPYKFVEQQALTLLENNDPSSHYNEQHYPTS